jgi:hypothetical protein
LFKDKKKSIRQIEKIIPGQTKAYLRVDDKSSFMWDKKTCSIRTYPSMEQVALYSVPVSMDRNRTYPGSTPKGKGSG